MIAIMGNNGVLARNGHIPWRIPDDIRRFKQLTMGRPIIMGRYTYMSIGHALPGRINIVLSSDTDYEAEDCIVCQSLEQALDVTTRDEIVIIGGGDVYSQAIFLADRLYLTIVDDDRKGDTWFPDYSDFKKVTLEEEHVYNGIDYRFLNLQR